MAGVLPSEVHEPGIEAYEVYERKMRDCPSGGLSTLLHRMTTGKFDFVSQSAIQT